MAPVDELVRLVRLGPDRVVVGRHLPGRGAWLCRGSVACLERAERRRAFARAFRAPVEPGAIARLRAELACSPL